MLEPERIADRNGSLPHLHRIRIAQHKGNDLALFTFRGRIQIHPQKSQIPGRILGKQFHGLVFRPVEEFDRDLLRPADHMVVGRDGSLRVNEKSRATPFQIRSVGHRNRDDRRG